MQVSFFRDPYSLAIDTSMTDIKTDVLNTSTSVRFWHTEISTVFICGVIIDSE